MQFSNEVLVHAIFFILSLCGFFVAKRIHNHKVNNTPLVCPIGFDCHAVVHSDYSKFLGIPVELAGMIYYAFISIFYLLLIFLPSIITPTMEAAFVFGIILIFVKALSFLAFLFSAYLISVQIFVIKKGCSWCIVSAIISAAIFISIFF